MKRLRELSYKAYSLLRYRVNYELQKLKRKQSEPAPTILIVATAQKVGSTWLVKLLRDLYLFKHAGLPEAVRHKPFMQKVIELDAPATPEFLSGLTENHLLKSHSPPPTQKLPDNVKLVTLVRDPRDVIVSVSFFLNHLNESQGGWPVLQTLPNDRSRIIYYLKHDEGLLKLLEAWSYTQAHDIHVIRYENLLCQAMTEMKKILDFVDIQVSDTRIQKAIHKNQFSKHSGGRPAGMEDNNSFFRKGIAGDWVNYFDEEIIDLVKTVHNGRWNRLLVYLGYEKSLDWSLPPISK